MDSIVNTITSYFAYFEQISVSTFVVSLLLVVGATSMLKKGLGKMARVVFFAGAYLFSRGIITTGMLLSWWDTVPEIVNTIFLIS